MTFRCNYVALGGSFLTTAPLRANGEIAARRAGRSVLVRLLAIGTVGCAARRMAAGPERRRGHDQHRAAVF